MLNAERKLVDALQEQADGAANPQLQKAFASHQAQTEKQVQRLEQAFESIQEQPDEADCAGIRGLIEEHDNFKDENPSPDILDIFNTGAAEKVERYEISAYEGMIRLARMMGHTKAAQLLSQNLKEEQSTLKKMSALSKKLKPENMGMEEKEPATGARGSGRGARRAA